MDFEILRAVEPSVEDTWVGRMIVNLNANKAHREAKRTNFFGQYIGSPPFSANPSQGYDVLGSMTGRFYTRDVPKFQSIRGYRGQFQLIDEVAAWSKDRKPVLDLEAPSE